MLTEIACGPISRSQVLEEIPFIYGWACNADDDRLWIVEKCALRWLGNGHRLLRSTEVPPSPRSWRELRSVDEAMADM